MKLWQKRMTSPADLPFGSKSEPPLPPPIGSVVSAVLENLLEAEKLEDAEVDTRVKAQPALERSNGAVELHAESPVDLHPAGIVLPGDTEQDLSLRLHDPLEDVRLAVLVDARSMTGPSDSSTSRAA